MVGRVELRDDFKEQAEWQARRRNSIRMTSAPSPTSRSLEMTVLSGFYERRPARRGAADDGKLHQAAKPPASKGVGYKRDTSHRRGKCLS